MATLVKERFCKKFEKALLTEENFYDMVVWIIEHHDKRFKQE